MQNNATFVLQLTHIQRNRTFFCYKHFLSYIISASGQNKQGQKVVHKNVS